LIIYSPKRSHLFATKLLQEENSASVKLKSLCLTRWTARTGAINAITKVIRSLGGDHATTKDEYGLKAGWLLHSLEKFNTMFGLKLSHLVFCTAEQVSLTLQKKSTALQEALVAVGAAKAYLFRIRSEDIFNHFYEEAVKFANLSAPELPRSRRRPAQLESGADPHVFTSPKAYYHFEACDVIHGELEEWFSHQHTHSIILEEKILINAANGNEYQAYIDQLKQTPYKYDVNTDDLSRHLPILQDIIRKADPKIKKVTSIQTICDALNINETFKEILPTVHQFLCLNLTVPISSARSERSFSAVCWLHFVTLMTEERLTNCFLLHAHKQLTDELNLVQVAKEFVNKTDERRNYFGSFCWRGNIIVLCVISQKKYMKF